MLTDTGNLAKLLHGGRLVHHKQLEHLVAENHIGRHMLALGNDLTQLPELFRQTAVSCFVGAQEGYLHMELALLAARVGGGVVATAVAQLHTAAAAQHFPA